MRHVCVCVCAYTCVLLGPKKGGGQFVEILLCAMCMLEMESKSVSLCDLDNSMLHISVCLISQTPQNE